MIASVKALGAGTTREIQADLRRRGIDVAYTTVGTVLSRLYHKGLVDRRRESFNGAVRYVYAYKDIEAKYLDTVLRGVIAAFGSRGVVHLAERIGEISPSELRRLRERLKV